MAQRWHRNKALASIIREGLPHLNQSAAFIQAARETRMPLGSHEEADGPTHRQESERQRLLRVVTECIDEMAQKDPCLSIQGDPIVILDIQVKPSVKSALVYWSLPYSILLSESLSFLQKELLQFRMEQVVEQRGEAKVQKLVSSVLRSYYPPKLHFKPAPPQMIHELTENMK